MNISFFKKLNFSDKSAIVYFTLLRLGPSSVRKLAEASNLNRGTTYDALKWLQSEGVVNFYHKDTKQYFVAEDPSKLHTLVKRRSDELHSLERDLSKVVPELKSLYDKGGEQPIARYYEGKDGLRSILEDVLDTTSKSKEKIYRIYSAVKIREYLYESFPSFTEERVKKGIRVRVISLGKGGELKGLDERKWLSHENGHSETYIFLYEGRTAYIAVNQALQPVGVVIENMGIFETQKIIFDSLWKKL